MNRLLFACAVSSCLGHAVAAPVGETVLLRASVLASFPPQEPGNQPSGFLLGSPLGFTAKDNPRIVVKAAGFDPGIPSNLPSNAPRPDFEGLVASITPENFGGPVPLLAMSMGIDVLAVEDRKILTDEFPAEPLPTDYYPVLELGQHGWYAIEFTVDRARLGAQPDLAPGIAAAGAETDQSVFCYVLPTSTAALLTAEQESVRILTPAALGLRAGGDEVHALNMHMGLYWTDLDLYPEVFTTRPLPTQASVYFTLDASRLSRAEAKSLGEAWGVPTVDSVTIYCTTWNGQAWSRPRVYVTAAALEISLPVGVAIDGLALDTKCTPEHADDELLYSLRETTTFAVPPERQMMHVAVATKDPRPIVVRRRDGYGSLGRQMRAGRGIGDFCTADPWVLAGRQIAVFQAAFLLDDFLIARRLPPDEAHVVPGSAGAGSVLQGRIDVSPPVRRPFGALIAKETMVSSPREAARASVVLPGQPTPLLLPEMGLAIAGFRHRDGKVSILRACMSWPQPTAATGEGTVRWGLVVDFTKPTTDPGNVQWQGEANVTYAGAPFCFDRELPDDGLLSPRRRDSGLLPAAAPPATGPRGAFAMQWTLQVEGRTYISPIAALRY